MLALIAALSAIACPQPDGTASPANANATSTSTSTSATTSATTSAASPAEITAEDLIGSEPFWPDIVALVSPFTPEGGGKPIRAGIRGALLRVEDDLRVRIAFGRHGTHAVPLEQTDLLARANEIRLGTRHKLGPNFVVHFGAQLVDAGSPELGPYPTPKLLEATRFLCVFADPRGSAFQQALPRLKQLAELPGLSSLLFPLQIPAGELGLVRDLLAAADWRVPFAYPGGADVQARSLVGGSIAEPVVLVVSPEGRVLLRSPLAAADLVDRIRTSIAG